MPRDAGPVCVVGRADQRRDGASGTFQRRRQRATDLLQRDGGAMGRGMGRAGGGGQQLRAGERAGCLREAVALDATESERERMDGDRVCS